MAVVVRTLVDLVVAIPLVIRSRTSLCFFASLIFVVFAVVVDIVVLSIVVLIIVVLNMVVLNIVVVNMLVVIAVVVFIISEVFNVERSSSNVNSSSFSPI